MSRLQIPASSGMIGRNKYEAKEEVTRPVLPDLRSSAIVGLSI